MGELCKPSFVFKIIIADIQKTNKRKKNKKRKKNTVKSPLKHFWRWNFNAKKLFSKLALFRHLVALLVVFSCLNKLCDPVEAAIAEVTDLMICAPWTSQTFSCLTNGIDHTDCCKSQGLPDSCLNLCSGNITQIDFSYFK